MPVASTILKYLVANAAGIVGQQPYKHTARFGDLQDWKYVDKLNTLAEFSCIIPYSEYAQANVIMERTLMVPFLKPFIGLITKKSTLDGTRIGVVARELAVHLTRNLFTINNEKDISYTDEDWFDPAWRFRRKVIVNKDFFSDDLIEFPMQLHNKHEGELPHSIVTARPDGADFRVTMPDGKTLIPYETEFWDTATNEFVIRFKLPVVKKGVENLVYLYYGNNAAPDAQQPAAVWSNSFAAVYHFQENPLTENYKDSTGNGNAGVPTAVTRVSGHHGFGASFDGANSRINCGSGSSLANIWAAGGAVEWWMRPSSDGEGDNGRVLDKTQWHVSTIDESAGFVRIRFQHNFSTTNGVWRSDRIIPINTTSMFAIEYNSDSVANVPVFYLNGERIAVSVVTTPVGTASSDSGSSLIIGNNIGQTATFHGWIDEVEVHQIRRSDNWYRSRYRNETLDANVKPFFLFFKNQEHYKKAANLIAQDILDSANVDMPSGMTWTLGEDFPTDVTVVRFTRMNHYEALNELSYILGKDLFFDDKRYKVFIGTKGRLADPEAHLDLMITSDPESTTDSFVNKINLVGSEDDRGVLLESNISTPTTMRYNYEKSISDSNITDKSHIDSIGNDLLKTFKNTTPQVNAEVPVSQFMRFTLQSGDILTVSKTKQGLVGSYRIMEIQATPTKVHLVLEDTKTATRRLKSQNVGELIAKLIRDKNRGG